MSTEDFWEQAEQVAEFATREPDHRLVALAKSYPDPGAVCVLDLGCAGGRNAELLARQGFDLVALDASQAMVEHVRRRLAPILGAEESRRRVRQARMDSLEGVADASVDLLVALGVYFLAHDLAELDRALGESARVLAPGGRCLVANFGPGFGPIETPLLASDENDLVVEHPRLGSICLLSAEELDRRFLGLGLTPEAATEVVIREADGVRRVTVNGLYRREGQPALGGA